MIRTLRYITIAALISPILSALIGCGAAGERIRWATVGN